MLSYILYQRMVLGLILRTEKYYMNIVESFYSGVCVCVLIICINLKDA